MRIICDLGNIESFSCCEIITMKKIIKAGSECKPHTSILTSNNIRCGDGYIKTSHLLRILQLTADMVNLIKKVYISVYIYGSEDKCPSNFKTFFIFQDPAAVALTHAQSSSHNLLSFKSSYILMCINIGTSEIH